MVRRKWIVWSAETMCGDHVRDRKDRSPKGLWLTAQGWLRMQPTWAMQPASRTYPDGVVSSWVTPRTESFQDSMGLCIMNPG